MLAEQGRDFSLGMAKTANLRVTSSRRAELRVFFRKRNLPAGIFQQIRIFVLLHESWGDLITLLWHGDGL